VRLALSGLALVGVFSTSFLSAQAPIQVGQSLTGRLTLTDQKFSDGSRYQMYAFDGKKGDTVAIDLTSDDFDANLLIADNSGNTLKRNDDSGETCNARLTFVPPSTGKFRIYANSSAQAELGEYRLSLARGPARTPSDTVCRGFGRVAGLIEFGQTVTGNLTSADPEFSGDSTYFQRWIIPVKASQAFTVDLVSNDFDSYLLLTKGRGDKLVENDDGGGGCHARLVYTAPDDHPLRIVVNTASRPRRQTGRFTLKVTKGALPTEPKGNNCRVTATASANTASVQPASAPRGGNEAASHLISVGQTQQGRLTRDDALLSHDSTYAQAWTIRGSAGTTITIDLESDAFDSYLFLRGPGISGGRDFQDSDSGGSCNARLTATFPQNGEYEIIVNTEDHYATGAFTLSVTNGSKPKSVARCSRSQ
jgi:hypothetical protein